MTDAWACVKYLSDMHPSNIWVFRPPKYLTDVCPSNILGLYTPEITDAWACVKFLTDMHPSNISGVQTPQIFDGCMSVK